MNFGPIVELYQLIWMFESHAQQRLAWRDAEEARRGRLRAEALAEAQLKAMLDANPSGSLGLAKLDDEDNLRRSGLLP